MGVLSLLCLLLDSMGGVAGGVSAWGANSSGWNIMNILENPLEQEKINQ